MITHKNNIIWLIVFLVIGICIGSIVCRKIDLHQFDKDLCSYTDECDSISRLFYLREDEQVWCYHMNKEEVLNMLPPPKMESSIIHLYDDKKMDKWHWKFGSYRSRLENTADTLIIQSYYWVIPFLDTPNLYVLFELQKDSSWIATSCIQWDSTTVQID